MSKITKFNGQDYNTLHRSLTRDRQKFVDATFPPEARSINASTSSSDVEWRRPTELVSDPHLVVDGIRGSDVMQGERGNPWFVTASAALTTRTDLLSCVLPNYNAQDYGHEFHPGIFRFVFCRHGRLYEVVIDDLLPTKKGRLVYSQSCELNEFWSVLLEKAYAKLHGDYASLSQGRVVDAVASFVRGIPEHWDMRQLRADADLDSSEEQDRLVKQFQVYLGRQSLLLFSLQPDNKTNRMGDWTKEGLVYGRGYILSEIQRVKLRDETTSVTLLKFQNAWFDLEWSGPWGDKSPEWNSMSLEYRERVDYKAKKDGVFWMSLQDALKQFTDIDICVVTSSVASARPWLIYTCRSQWSAGRVAQARDGDSNEGPSAGGSYEYRDSYAINPQYLLSVTGESNVTVSFCLEQGDPSTACHSSGQLAIGLDIFRAEINRKSRMKEPPRESWTFSRGRPWKQPSVLLRATLQPGVYLVVPCTLAPGEEQTYTLRSFSQSNYQFEPLPDLVPQPSGCCSCCEWNQKAVTRLIVTKLTGVNAYLKQKDPMMVSVRVDCEAADLTICQSRYYHEDKADKDTHSLDFKVLLYRHQLMDPIEIEVFGQSAYSFTKQYIGVASILDQGCTSETSKETELTRNGKKIPVKFHCTVQCSADTDYF